MNTRHEIEEEEEGSACREGESVVSLKEEEVEEFAARVRVYEVRGQDKG